MTDTSPTSRPTVAARPSSWGTRVRGARHTVQLLVAAWVAWTVVGHWRAGGPSAEGLCPFGGFETLWTLVTTGRAVPHVHVANVVLAVMVLLMALAGRSFFCGWMCTFGAVQGAIYRAGDVVVQRVPALRRRRRQLARGNAAARLRGVDRVLRWGRWAVLVWALGGAAVTGTMVIRDYDPWTALLSVVEFELSTGFAVLALTLLLSLFVHRPFCRYACPLGAVQALVGTASPMAIERGAESCLGCDLCSRSCPVGIQVDTMTRITDSTCIGCMECVVACPSRPALGVTVAGPIPRFGSATEAQQ